MLDYFIGFLTAFLTVLAFRFVHRKASLPRQHLLYYFLVFIFGAFILQSHDNIFFFTVCFLLLGYVCLEDFYQSSVPIAIPIFIALFVFFFDGNPQSLFFTALFFLLFIIWDILWSRFVSQKSDILFVFPVALFPFSDEKEWIAYAIFLLIVVLARVSKETFIGEGDAYFILPLLLLIDLNTYIAFFLFTLFLAMPFAFANKQKGYKEFAFTPFLLGGYVLVSATEPIFPLTAILLSVLSTFFMWVSSFRKK